VYLATRGDLLDCCIVLEQPIISEEKRMGETEFWPAFNAARPRILGALCDAVSSAIRTLPTTKLERKPRMADFALWVTAAEEGLGWKPGTFMDAYATNIQGANDAPLTASLIYEPLRKVLDKAPIQNEAHVWEGTTTELLKALALEVDEAAQRKPGWPGDATRLAGALTRIKPNLRRSGVVVGSPGRTKNARKLRIERKCE
jgi:putative DNA primase/helicase